MFSTKMLALFVVAFVVASSDAQLLASPYYYPTAAAYSPYAYPSVYGGFATYPAFYAWGSNKGGKGADNIAQPSAGKLTNNQ